MHLLTIGLVGACLMLAGTTVWAADASTDDNAGAQSQQEASSQKTNKDEDHKDSDSKSESRQEKGEKHDQSPCAADTGDVFNYDTLKEKAEKLAQKDYEKPASVPDFLTKLDPETYEKIRFKRDAALGHAENLPFQVMFYPPGSYYTHAVTVNIIKDGRIQQVKFDKDDFNYPDDDLKKKMPDDVGFAGFKILHTLNDPDKYDEVLSFLGASYFRALGVDQHYGLSARGLAIDTGNTSKGEEFPRFKEFWLVDPNKGASRMVIYALLDSPSITGAYKFILKPGSTTKISVEETLYTRKAIDKLGIAPLTSMFTWGENSLARLQDYRPEAHDSDGLLIASKDHEWLWRPLVDPQKLWIHQYDANHVRGFGLMQRDRNFDHYQDLGLEYEKRPSAWIKPKGDWGDGHLELVEIPSDSEMNDNIALYWVPREKVKADEMLHYAYDIEWTRDLEVTPTLGHVVATRIGKVAAEPGKKQDQVQVSIDFAGGELSQLTDADAVKAKVNAMRDGVDLDNIKAIRNPHTQGWRLMFTVPTSALGEPLDLRAYLADGEGGGLTETWSYLLALP